MINFIMQQQRFKWKRWSFAKSDFYDVCSVTISKHPTILQQTVKIFIQVNMKSMSILIHTKITIVIPCMLLFYLSAKKRTKGSTITACFIQAVKKWKTIQNRLPCLK